MIRKAALQSLVSAARLCCDAVTVLQHSVVGHSQGNGSIERAVRMAEEMVRTQKLDVADRISQKLIGTHRVIPWLVEHAMDPG